MPGGSPIRGDHPHFLLKKIQFSSIFIGILLDTYLDSMQASTWILLEYRPNKVGLLRSILLDTYFPLYIEACFFFLLFID